jgi:hypothetical protein
MKQQARVLVVQHGQEDVGQAEAGDEDAAEDPEETHRRSSYPTPGRLVVSGTLTGCVGAADTLRRPTPEGQIRLRC